MAASANGAGRIRWVVGGYQSVSSEMEIASKIVSILIDQDRKPEVQVRDVRLVLADYMEEELPSQKLLVAVILNDTAKEPAVRLRDIKLLLSSGSIHYRAEELPSPEQFGLSQVTYLDIYWWMLGQERGNPLTIREREWNIPMKSAKTSIGSDSLSAYVSSLRASDGSLPD